MIVKDLSNNNDCFMLNCQECLVTGVKILINNKNNFNRTGKFFLNKIQNVGTF